MCAEPQRRLTVDEYLAYERESEDRHEYPRPRCSPWSLFPGRGRTAFRLEASLLVFEDDFDRDRELLSLSAGLTWRLGRHRPPAVTVAGAKS